MAAPHRRSPAQPRRTRISVAAGSASWLRCLTVGVTAPSTGASRCGSRPNCRDETSWWPRADEPTGGNQRVVGSGGLDEPRDAGRFVGGDLIGESPYAQIERFVGAAFSSDRFADGGGFCGGERRTGERIDAVAARRPS